MQREAVRVVEQDKRRIGVWMMSIEMGWECVFKEEAHVRFSLSSV